MQDQIHGHEVMKMMLEADAPYTRATLREAMVSRFGEEARYYTCSAENMTPEELITFLDERGKFVASGDGFTTDPNRICEHG